MLSQCHGSRLDGEVVSVTLPQTVDLRVEHTDPALKGATAQAQTKPATLETGLVIQVPPYLESGEMIRRLEGHTGPVNAVAVLDERRVVSASWDQTLRVWDVESGRTTVIFALDAPLSAVTVHPDNVIIAGDSQGALHYLDLR